CRWKTAFHDYKRFSIDLRLSSKSQSGEPATDDDIVQHKIKKLLPEGKSLYGLINSLVIPHILFEVPDFLLHAFRFEKLQLSVVFLILSDLSVTINVFLFVNHAAESS